MGLRGRLTLFTGFFLVLIVSVVIAVSRKQQERVFSDSVLRETSPYFLPAKRMVVESAHLEKNLVSIEKANLKNQQNMALYGAKAISKSRLVFPDEYFKRATDLQESAYEQSVDQQNLPKGRFTAWKVTAAIAAAQTRPEYIENYSALLQNQILLEGRFSEVYLKSLGGLDRRLFRLQALDRRGVVRYLPGPADTMSLSDTYNGAPINNLKLDSPDLASIPESAYHQTIEIGFKDGDRSYRGLTAAIARNEEIAFRARLILQTMDPHLKKLMVADAKTVRDFQELYKKIRAREDQLLAEKPEVLFIYDADWKKLAADYEALLAARDKIREDAFARLLRKKSESDAAMHDAIANLRAAYLDGEILLKINYAMFARGYTGREDWRKQFENRYMYLRKWVTSGGFETNYEYASGSEQLLYNRRDAFEIMAQIDATPLTDLARNALIKDSAGFVRVIADLKELHTTEIKQRDRLVDTALSFGIRVFFMAALLSVFLVRRIQEIIEGARKVGQGNLTVAFPHTGTDEIGVLSDSLNIMVHGLKEREQLRGEMSAAEEIQKRLLPEKMPANMEGHLSFGTFYKAMQGVGGDYFDVMEAGKDSIAFCIADVSSHGAGPAIIMTMLRSYLHAAIRKSSDPAQIAVDLNTRMFDETPPGMFISMFLGIYDRNTHQINAINAGHCKSMVVRYKTGQIEEFEATGLPLGAVDSQTFKSVLQSQSIKLSVGDLFFQHTDGVDEAMNATDQLFGMDRIRTLISASGKKKPEVILEAIAKEVEDFTGKKVLTTGPSQQHDDIAMIAFRRLN